ncbi:hypothetical protein [Roseovarius sp. 217]|uniref:hypothetical protein n=1 Tax=Roseovarius sp. (strain 217) TaxID=314264 RepID=UPI0000685988|nr:hypothetical protein [Roseovarius sp. 217]EAQ27034.1 hypothetical protein ROS217_20947 [Roseovarius sp. 217]
MKQKTGKRMQVVIHAGAHHTDDDRLINCLSANREMLAEHGTNVPDPQRYRRLVRDILHQAQDSGLAPDARDILVDAISNEGAVDRLVLSNPGFFGTPKMAVGGGTFYGAAEHRLNLFRQLFPDDQIELFLGVVNPATFLPPLLRQTEFDTIEALLRGYDVAQLRWSELVTRIRTHHPDIPVTVWCNEDTPLIWSQVVRELAGIDPTVQFEGEFSLLEEIMTPAGLERFRGYVAAHPGMTEVQKRRVVAAFLDKFADEAAIEEELDVPGWTDAVVGTLTELYDEDMFTVQRIQGVQVITP